MNRDLVTYFRDLANIRFHENGRARSTPNEIELFRCLLSVLLEVPAVSVTEVHGQVAQVKFDLPAKFSFGNRCEIADLLVVWFSKKKNECRLALMQAKREDALFVRSRFPNCDFHGSSRQHYLMVNLPQIVGWYGSYWNGGRDFLRLGMEDSLFHYGVFHECNLGWDMLALSPEKVKFPSYGKHSVSLHFKVESLESTTIQAKADGATYSYTTFALSLQRYLARLVGGSVGQPIDLEHNKWVLRLVQDANAAGTFSKPELARKFIGVFGLDVNDGPGIFPGGLSIPMALIDGDEGNLPTVAEERRADFT